MQLRVHDMHEDFYAESVEGCGAGPALRVLRCGPRAPRHRPPRITGSVWRHLCAHRAHAKELDARPAPHTTGSAPMLRDLCTTSHDVRTPSSSASSSTWVRAPRYGFELQLHILELELSFFWPRVQLQTLELSSFWPGGRSSAPDAGVRGSTVDTRSNSRCVIINVMTHGQHQWTTRRCYDDSQKASPLALGSNSGARAVRLGAWKAAKVSTLTVAVTKF